jgi:Carboxypeptidase regulatory-like domain
MTNSTYVRQIEVPPDGREIAIDIPEGFLPVRVVNALNNQPVAGATIRWTGSGSRVEATVTAAGDALLEGAGSTGGTLAVSAQGYEPAEKPLTEPPGVSHEIALMPLPQATNARVRVITASGEPLADAVVALISANPAAVPRVAVTDAKGVVAFSDVPSGSLQLIASADGFVTSMMRLEKDRASDAVFTLSRGYRVIASVELAPTAGPQLVRVVNDADVPMDDFLDNDSDRGLEPPGRLSLGPLPSGTYVIEVRGAGGRRQQRLSIIDRDVYATFR